MHAVIEQNHKNTSVDETLKREKVAKQICARLNNYTELKPSLITVISMIKELSHCQAVSIRLHDQGDYPYYVYNGFPAGFIKKENSLCSKDKNGKRIKDPDTDEYNLECMCGNVIRGRFDDSLPFFSSKGSFWSNNTSAMLASTSEEDRQARTRNHCNSCGYESVALIPIKSNDKRIGLVQINDKRTGMFGQKFIEFVEMIGEQIGLAVENSMSFEKIKDQKNKLETAYNQLEEMQEKLVESRKLAALGNLVSGMAHEINTPVGIGITGISSFIKKNGELDTAFKAKKLTQEDLEDFIRFADQSGQLVLTNLNRTANLIKTFKQIAVEQNSDSIKLIKLKQYFEYLISSLKPRLIEKNIKTDIQCDPAVEIRSYPGALGQILINLIMNSIVHAFPDSDSGNIMIIAVLKENKLEIQYMDDGIGIENKLLPKIFDPFVTSNRQTGSGLGLSIVHNLVNQVFKGTIHCESSKGKGVQFFITVPSITGDING